MAQGRRAVNPGGRPVRHQGITGGAFLATAPRRAAAHTLSLTIGDAANRRAGTYNDVITVEIAGAAP